MTETDRKNIELLEESIAHWERMRESFDECLKTGERPDVDDCALCGEYWHLCCKGCPIAEDTGENFCRKCEPYRNASNEWDKRIDAHVAGEPYTREDQYDTLMAAMIQYLAGLRDKLKARP